MGFPDYNNAYILQSWNVGTSTVIIPDNGWMYILDGNRTEDINGRQSRAGYPTVTGIILNSNIKQRCDYSCTPSYGQNIITTTVATTFDGYASSIIPVSKGTTITVNSIEDDGCQVWFIPTKK